MQSKQAVTYAHKKKLPEYPGSKWKIVAGKDLLGIKLLTGDSVLNAPDEISDKYNPRFGKGFSEDKLFIPRFCVHGADGYGIDFKKSFVPADKLTANQTSILAYYFSPKIANVHTSPVVTASQK